MSFSKGSSRTEKQSGLVKLPHAGSRPRISLCMIVKNEAERIDRCISSTQGVVDEICIVDTGSTDDTIEIVKRFGAAVSQYKWDDDFSAPRNEALKMAHGDWILQLDADEELTPEARRVLPELVASQHMMGYMLPIDSLTPHGVNRTYALRLFRRHPSIRYHGRIHENVGPSIVHLGKFEAAEAPIRHYGYTEFAMDAHGKRSRNGRLLEKALAEQPNDPWYLYYYAVECYVNGDPHKALDIVSNLPKHVWVQGEPVRLAINCHISIGQWSQAFEWAARGVKDYPHMLNLWWHLAILGLGTGRHEACQTFVRALENLPRTAMGDKQKTEGLLHFIKGCLASDIHTKDSEWRQGAPRSPYCRRSLMRLWLGQHGLAKTLSMIRCDTLFGNKVEAWRMLLQALIDRQAWDAALSLLKLNSANPPVPESGIVHWVAGEKSEARSIWRQTAPDGLLRHLAVSLLCHEPVDRDVTHDALSPMQRLALKDLQDGSYSWRLVELVPVVMDLGVPELIERLTGKCPFLAEAVVGYYRVHIAPGNC